VHLFARFRFAIRAYLPVALHRLAAKWNQNGFKKVNCCELWASLERFFIDYHQKEIMISGRLRIKPNNGNLWFRLSMMNRNPK